MDLKPLGVAVVGLGVGEQHARAYAGRGDCRLLWLHDHDGGKARSLAAELGARSVASRYEELLEDPAVDLVSIASFDDDHFEQVTAALAAGKHSFVEKPLCRTVDEMRAVRSSWETGGRRHLSSNLVLRAAPLYRWIRDAAASGKLGEIYSFDGDYLYGRVHKITEGWRKEVEDYSVMLGGGVHMVDLMIWITGQRPESVYSLGNRLCTRGTAFRYNDHVASMFKFSSGMVGRITANFGCVHRHQHVVRIFGTKATVMFDDQGPRIIETRDPSVPARTLDLEVLPASKGALIPDFVSRIVERADPSAGIAQELDTVAACVAADEALKNGAETEVRYA